MEAQAAPTANQMSVDEFAQQEANHIQGHLVNELNEALAQTKMDYPAMVQKSELACAALSAIKSIDNDEQDANVERTLVKVRNTYELITKMRKGITSGLDSIKSKLMEPEKAISNLDTDKGNEYFRVKRLRDEYVAAKVRKQKEEAEKAEKERARGIEFARLKADFETRFFDNIVDLLSALRQSLDGFLGTITLENFEESSKRLNVKPAIKRDTFENWFVFQTTLGADDRRDFINQVREQYTYDSVNAKYQDQATPIMQEYIDKLPALKMKLLSIASMDAENAAKALKELEDQRTKDLADAEAAAVVAKNDNAAQAQHNSQLEQLDVTFNTQLVLQSQATVSGALKKNRAIVECDPKDIVKVFSQVLLACFMSPKFPGYIKRDKQGMPLATDENGVPQYTKWAEELLSFFADNCQEIPGIRFVEVVTSSQRKKA